MGINVKTIYYAECGVFEEPLEALVHYYVSKGADLEQIKAGYYAFRAKVQNNTKEKIDASQWHFNGPVEDCVFVTDFHGKPLSPISDFRINSILYTHTEFITSFLINPGQLHRLETGTQRTLPIAVSDALMHCGAPGDFLKELSERTIRFGSR